MVGSDISLSSTPECSTAPDNGYSFSPTSLMELMKKKHPRGVKRSRHDMTIWEKLETPKTTKESLDIQLATTMECLELMFEHQQKLEEMIRDLHRRLEEFISSPPSTFFPSPPPSSPSSTPAIVRRPSPTDDKELRSRQVLIKGVSIHQSLSHTVNTLISITGSNPCLDYYSSVTPVFDSTVTSLVLTFSRPQDVPSFLRSLTTRRRDGDSWLRAISARPNYGGEDLARYRSAWRDAISRNDACGEKMFIVRNFTVVPLQQKEEWIVHQRKGSPPRPSSPLVGIR